MSDTSTEHDLGPKPEPATEKPELFPGGTDAVDDPERYHDEDPAVRDLDPHGGPKAAHEIPDEVAELEDKQQEPDEDSGSPADEGGETEPPA
ncbi:hypothetical protein [Nocardioides taihuensis]|uniref:Uncharacterized protein n=1 Tax=Nocardioides taihuensis TaxID=1835606 RepID=A0ABW0BL58_9ACTN